MRKYVDENGQELSEVICNGCGRSLKVVNGILKEGCFNGDHVFGYFSSRDGMRHRFELCEECYRKMIENFKIPVEESDEKELL